MKLKSIMIILSMLLMLLPSPASAMTIEEGTDGGNLTWTYDHDSCTLTIDGSGAMQKWTNREDVPWRDYSMMARKIIIGPYVRTITPYAFTGCNEVEEIQIGENVVLIDHHAFESALNLFNITIPQSVKTIARLAFANCSQLHRITLKGISTNISVNSFTSGSNIITDVFYAGSEDDWNAQDYYSIFPDAYVYFNYIDNSDSEPELTDGSCGDNATWELEDDGTLTIFGEGDMYDYDFIDDYMTSPWYSHRDEITNVIISEGITSIGSFAFARLKNLENVTISSSITYIGGGSFHDSEIINLHITDLDSWCRIDFDVDSSDANPLTYAQNLYIDGELASTIEIPDTITTIKSLTFQADAGITEIIIPDSVTTLEMYALARCIKVEQIHIPDSITEIPDLAFADCTNLQSITIPDSVTTIGNNAFAYCGSLQKINLPNNLTSIDHRTFLWCKSLDNIILPDSMTSIAEYTFAHCIDMTNITIPNTITSIDGYAFYSCDSLETIYYNGTEDEWNEISVATGNDCLLNANVIFTNDENTDKPNVPEIPDEPVNPPSGGGSGGSGDDIDRPNMLWIADTEASSGDEVTVYVKAGSDVQAAIGSFMLNYDTSMLTYKCHEFLGELSNLSAMVNPNYANSGKLYANFINAQNVNLEGNILAITFEVAPHTPNNICIPVMFDSVEFYYETEEPSPVGFMNGNIWVLNYMVGDVNDDGIIDLLDAFRVLKYDAGLLPSFTMSEEKAADANRDDVVNILDALLIQSHCAKLDTIF